MYDMNKVMRYLQELERNNHREWYQAHKQERLEAAAEFEAYLLELMEHIAVFDKGIQLCDPKELTFKMVRDTRFSSDKSPYNPAFRAHIGPKGKLPIPVGYYICLRPNGNTIIGGGMFADMFKEATELMRRWLNTHGAEFDEVLHQPAFQKEFVLLGTKLKQVPKNYDAAHPYGEYLKYKSWFVEHSLADETVTAENFMDISVHLCTVMNPFNDCLNEALQTFEMPKRP